MVGGGVGKGGRDGGEEIKKAGGGSSRRQEKRIPRRRKWPTASNIIREVKLMRTILEAISLGEEEVTLDLGKSVAKNIKTYGKG